MRADLHTHTTASDGSLAPAELLARATAAGIELLAVTDHDGIDGCLALAGARGGPQIIAGIELSTTWQNAGVHIVGLNIDLHDSTLRTGIDLQRTARQVRAERIAGKLTKLGFRDTLEGALRVAGNGNVGRPHFARFLAESGQLPDEKTAFKRHLGRGKPCDIRSGWAALPDVITWIHAAGGTAVLAHPLKYKLTHRKLEALVNDFRAAGGDAVEVVSGLQDAMVTERIARLTNRHGLLASGGSDFHQPGQHWSELGCATALPAICRPVWQSWDSIRPAR